MASSCFVRGLFVAAATSQPPLEHLLSHSCLLAAWTFKSVCYNLPLFMRSPFNDFYLHYLIIRCTSLGLVCKRSCTKSRQCDLPPWPIYMVATADLSMYSTAILTCITFSIQTCFQLLATISQMRFGVVRGELCWDEHGGIYGGSFGESLETPEETQVPSASLRYQPGSTAATACGPRLKSSDKWGAALLRK